MNEYDQIAEGMKNLIKEVALLRAVVDAARPVAENVTSENWCELQRTLAALDQTRQGPFIMGMDLAKPGSDTTGFMCNYCKAVMFTAKEADQHECNPVSDNQD